MPNIRDYLRGLLLVVVGTAMSLGGVVPAEAQADKPAEVAPRGQREATDISYGRWQKLCFKPGGALRLCRTSITGRFATGQIAVRLDVIERDDSQSARLQLFVPVGMYLQQQPKLMIDQGTPFRLPYTWCLTNLCIAADVAPPKTIEDMTSGKALMLELVDSNLLALTTSVPLAQFAAAYKGAPAKTLEQYVEE
ncbi:invasion associated locus B family protein [Bradyrhizobium daqingense]|uniref:Invasion protein IalB n=1 Tax=Bradyrhizobium daqingense TaxID=993502 RepID=A0A562KTK4_9BRAD|nr:invasion associated locus B family protein [Bradyrhizobium daqingense]TWH98751.1 invasion protein IalB [Bradyrhizobium daqingense]UFS86055.1 invasion associated locus B family protein [Bradyrhizobium daqingense]